MPTPQTLAKAERYLAEGRVHLTGPDQAEVQGSQAQPYHLEKVGRPMVDDHWRCDCPAKLTCAHILAVEMLERGEYVMTRDERLNQPLEPSRIRQRKAAGMSLSYLEGHDVIRKANEIFGFGGWRRETLELQVVTDRPYASSGKEGVQVAYIARVRVHVLTDEGWVANDGVGYGQGVSYRRSNAQEASCDYGTSHESAAKEAETDAMKRALICWGDQFGLALYDKDQKHVGIEDDTWEEAVEQPEALPPAALNLDAACTGALPMFRAALVELGCDTEEKLRATLRKLDYPEPEEKGMAKFLAQLATLEKRGLLEYLQEEAGK